MKIIDKLRYLALLHPIINKIVKNLTITRPSDIEECDNLLDIVRKMYLRRFERKRSFPYDLHARQDVSQEIPSAIL